jgi:HAD superfamily phosphatase
MDGVLVEVTGSYREAIIGTVEHFTGRRPTHDEIQAYKNRGGFNDDWLLSHTLIGNHVPYQEVVEVFQRLYLGKNYDGLVLQERWMVREGLLERLAERYRLALFTGRPREEAWFALKRFAPLLAFDPVVGMEDVQRKKPDPEGLMKIREAIGGDELIYVGDTVDDCLAATAAGAKFIGVAAPALPSRQELADSFARHGAIAVVPDVNSVPLCLCGERTL